MSPSHNLPPLLLTMLCFGAHRPIWPPFIKPAKTPVCNSKSSPIPSIQSPFPPKEYLGSFYILPVVDSPQPTIIPPHSKLLQCKPPAPYIAQHEDSGIGASSSSSSSSSGPSTPANDKPAAQKSKEKLTIAAADDDFIFTGDLDRIPPPKVLGGGPTFTMPEARRIEAMTVLSRSWTGKPYSMIPTEAEELFPPGPTFGPYRTTPKTEEANRLLKRSKR